MDRLKADFSQYLFYNPENLCIDVTGLKTFIFGFLCSKTTPRNEKERLIRANLPVQITALIDQRKLQNLHFDMRLLERLDRELLKTLADKQTEIIVMAIKSVGRDSYGFQRDLINLLIEEE